MVSIVVVNCTESELRCPLAVTIDQLDIVGVGEFRWLQVSVMELTGGTILL